MIVDNSPTSFFNDFMIYCALFSVKESDNPSLLVLGKKNNERHLSHLSQSSVYFYRVTVAF